MESETSRKGALTSWVKTHRTALTRAFYAVMIVAVIFVAQKELSNLSGDAMRQILSEQRPVVIVGLLILGVVAFTATGLYDVYAARHFGVELKLTDALKIGWVAQAFNNFAGLGGLTGGTIRQKYYTSKGTDSSVAMKVTLSVWAANLLGLFVMLLATLPLGVKWDGKLVLIPLVLCLYLPLYFFARWIKVGKFDLGKTPFGLQNFRQKLEMTFASLVDWLAAALFFWLTLRVFVPELPIGATIFVYATATIVGLVSMLPAGVGTFDMTVLTLLTAMHHDTTNVVLGILLFRVAYYVLPWLLATAVSFSDVVKPRRGLGDQARHESWTITALWIGVAFCGIVLVASVLTPEIFDRIHMLRGILPKSILKATTLTTLLIGIMLIVLSIGLRARVRRIYWASLVLLVAGAIGSLLKGLDYEEALLLATFAGLLFASRRSFDAEPLTPSWKSMLGGLALLVATPLIVMQTRFLGHGHRHPFHQHMTGTGHMTTRIIFFSVLAVVIVLLLMFSRSKKLSFVPQSDDDVAKFRSFIAQYGANDYSYLYALGDKQVFYGSSGKVALMYRPHRGTLLVLGDPIGDMADLDETLDEFIVFAHEHDMLVAFYEVAGRFLEPLVDQGLRFIKVGEDATLNLDTYSNVGNSGKVFRRMRNRMVQNGTHFEFVEPPFTAEFMAELKDVSDAWLGDREEMGFSLGFFDLDYLSSGPIAIVRGEDRIEGFANIVPVSPGTVSFDLMRIRPDAPGGTMDGLLVSLVERAKEQGYERINLGMAPLSGVGNKLHSKGKARIVHYIHDFGNRVYNFRGLRDYKEKFNPTWESRYLVYASDRSLASVLLAILDVIHRPDRENCTRDLSIRSWQDAEVTSADDDPEPAASEGKGGSGKADVAKASNAKSGGRKGGEGGETGEPKAANATTKDHVKGGKAATPRPDAARSDSTRPAQRKDGAKDRDGSSPRESSQPHSKGSHELAQV